MFHDSKSHPYDTQSQSSGTYKLNIDDGFTNVDSSNFVVNLTTRNDNPCWSWDSQIKMWNGTYENAEDISVGNQLLGYSVPSMIDATFPDWHSWTEPDIDDGSLKMVVVTKANTTTVQRYTLLNGTEKLSNEHPFLVERAGTWGWIKVKDMLAGDTILLEDETTMDIISVLAVESPLTVVRIDVENTDTFFGGSFGGSDLSALGHNK